MPRSSAEAVRLWAQAYASYAKSAVAGGTVPTALAPIPTAGPFFDALDQTLRAMWTAVAWAGPGLAGTTTLVPLLSPALRAVGQSQLRNTDPERALSAIADALHTYTLGIAVTVVTPAGVPSVVPVT